MGSIVVAYFQAGLAKYYVDESQISMQHCLNCSKSYIQKHTFVALIKRSMAVSAVIAYCNENNKDCKRLYIIVTRQAIYFYELQLSFQVCSEKKKKNTATMQTL